MGRSSRQDSGEEGTISVNSYPVDSWNTSKGVTEEIADPSAEFLLRQRGIRQSDTDKSTVKILEEPKVALDTGFWSSFLCYGLIMHTIALGLTLGICQLSWRSVYWADYDHWQPKWFLLNLDQNGSSNLLQFAAKIHEIFVIASLSLMVVHVVRRMLIGRGVPLGLLAGAYQVGSAEYFVSPPFSRPCSGASSISMAACSFWPSSPA